MIERLKGFYKGKALHIADFISYVLASGAEQR